VSTSMKVKIRACAAGGRLGERARSDVLYSMRAASFKPAESISVPQRRSPALAICNWRDGRERRAAMPVEFHARVHLQRDAVVRRRRRTTAGHRNAIRTVRIEWDQ
jgi:hypothetical protein